MTEEKRTLIETFLPVAAISEEAKIEKLGNAKPPSSTMHYWWTRKPLIAARAAVLASLLPSDFDITEFKKLLGLGRDSRAYTYDIPQERIEQLKKEYEKVWGKIPVILDPFAGGGSIPFEAMRVGIGVIANDYNAMAYLILQATLDYPNKYGDSLIKDVEKGFEWIFQETKNELENYYPKYEGKDVAAYIWAWKVICPACGFDNPLVGQWGLCRKKNKNIFIDYDKPEYSKSELSLKISNGNVTKEGNCSGGKGVCLHCGSHISNEIVMEDIKQRKCEQLLALVVNGRKGKEYYLPSNEDLKAIQITDDIVNKNLQAWIIKEIVPNDDIPDDTRGSLSVRLYLPKWFQLLNSRQLILFVILEKNIRNYCDNVLKSQNIEYKSAVATYLSFLFRKHIDRNCRSITWDRTNEQISHVLANRGVGMNWDHAEVNPFVKGSGTLGGMIENINRGLKFSESALRGRSKISITNKSITQLDQSVNLIISDPPYFDDVRYAEFSTFFYSWERRVLKHIRDPGEIQSVEEMSVGGNGRTPEFFSRLFNISMNKIDSLLSDDGMCVLFFAHSLPQAWGFVINSMQKSGFRITATWPVHTESTTNPLAKGNASIMSSIIIVARKRKSDKSGYIEEIQDDVKKYLMKRLDEFWSYGLRGADLTVSAMGATLDVITQYSEIKSYTGDMQIKDVLELVQKYVAQYVLDRYMKNASSLDPQTSFYLYTKLSGLNGMPFDTANLIAKSMNVDLKLFDLQGLIKKIDKGKTKGITLLNWAERETNGKNSLIDCVQFIMTTYSKSGFTEVERELTTIPFSRNEIKDVLEALLSLPTEDPERQVAQKILERMGGSFPQRGQTGLDNF